MRGTLLPEGVTVNELFFGGYFGVVYISCTTSVVYENAEVAQEEFEFTSAVARENTPDQRTPSPFESSRPG